MPAEFHAASGGPPSTPATTARTAPCTPPRAYRSCPFSSWHLRFSFHSHDAPFQSEHLAVNEGVRHFSPCLLHDSGKCRPRNPHLLCRLLLIEPVQVRQPQGFDFIQSQRHLFEGTDRNPGRPKKAGIRRKPDMTQATRSWHTNGTFTDDYEHMFIIATCQEVCRFFSRISPVQQAAALFWTKGDSSRRRLMIWGIFSMARSTSSSAL